MQLRILVFAEFAAVTSDGKLVIAGVIDGAEIRSFPGAPPRNPTDPFPLPRMALVAKLVASIAEGLTHSIAMRVRHEDGAELGPFSFGDFSFKVNPVGRPMEHQLIVTIPGMTVPVAGDYEFELLVDGEPLGSTPFYVTDLTAPPHESPGEDTPDDPAAR
jgi:hypothetical protein